jgi:DNA-binding transcriptional LysR family regulator
VANTEIARLFQRLADIEVSLIEAPDYLARVGPFETLSDCAGASFIGFDTADRLVPQLNAMGIPVTRSAFGFATTSGPAMLELARAGAGIALLPTSMAQAGLMRVHADAPVFPMETWLVTHREIQTSRRIRLVFDHLAEVFADRTWGLLSEGEAPSGV